MIDSDDFTIPGSGVLKNKLGIIDPAALSKAAADSTDLRLAELQTSPIRGGFDSTHLQEIHRHLFQDLYDWAGELRTIDAGDVSASHLEKSLNSVFDRLNRESHLKGLSAEEWVPSASLYICDLKTIQPFLAGNDIAIQEFSVELARKNNMSLQWDTTPGIASDSSMLLSQTERSANLRRLIMLAVDCDPTTQRSNHGLALTHENERFLPFVNPLL
jgi:cell filamentation protein